MPTSTRNMPGTPQMAVADHAVATREGRSRSISQALTLPTGNKHRMSVSRSPARSPAPPSPVILSQSQKLRQPFQQNNSSYHHQRHSSFAGIDSSDMSSSIGLPYTFQSSSSSSTVTSRSLSPNSASLASKRPILNTTVPVSRGSSITPATSLEYPSHSAQLRRHSECTPRRPSTAEVFDLMEREQDAIVLKLMREIQQLKEDNRALLQTINLLTNPSSSTNARASASKSRRSSSVISPEDVLDMSKASLRRGSMSPDPQIPRSMINYKSPQSVTAGCVDVSREKSSNIADVNTF